MLQMIILSVHAPMRCQYGHPIDDHRMCLDEPLFRPRLAQTPKDCQQCMPSSEDAADCMSRASIVSL
jgi:hypothetical protein